MSHLFTKEQFLEEFEKVIDSFGDDHWPDVRVNMIFDELHGVSIDWLKARVKDVILAWDQKFNWVESAKSERVRSENKELKRLEETAFKYGNGLENVLKGLGVKSLSDVLEQRKVTKKNDALEILENLKKRMPT